MIKLIRTLSPENGMNFEDIMSFQTTNYVGIWNHESESFVLMAEQDNYFCVFELHNCNNLDELDNEVYKMCEEHIIGVSSESNYRILLNEHIDN